MDDTTTFKKLSRTGIFFLILYGLFLLGCALIGNFLIALIIGSLSILSAFLVLIFQPRMRRRVQRRQEMRQAALAGDTSLAPLAFPQPVPNEHALPLPFTIKLKPKASAPFIVAGLVTAVWVILLLTVGFLSVGWAGLSAAISESVPGTVFVFGYLFPLIFIIGLFVIRQRIEITDESLTTHLFNSTSSIRWDEVKLFALLPANKGASIVHYELSSSANMLSRGILLPRLRHAARLQLLKPITSLDEYDRQMDALLSLIAAKTRLPLYDLRG